MVLQRNVPGVTRSKQYTPVSLLHDILYLNHGVTKMSILFRPGNSRDISLQHHDLVIRYHVAN
jgi:hypothetical protein